MTPDEEMRMAELEDVLKAARAYIQTEDYDEYLALVEAVRAADREAADVR